VSSQLIELTDSRAGSHYDPSSYHRDGYWGYYKSPYKSLNPEVNLYASNYNR
jgi:hypothetical protein